MSQPPLLEAIERHEIGIERVLRELLERCERDPQLVADLDACNFQPYPSPSDEIDCLNPWFFVIAMNGAGSAYGLYLHPAAKPNGGPHPWVYWEHEDDTLRFMADDTGRFLRGLIADTRGWSEEPDAVDRAASALRELGVAIDGEAIELDFEARAAWLPPIEEDVEDVEVYLAMLDTDRDAAERGLLAHRMQHDERATEALDQLDRARGWRPPRALDD
ncbi:MAG: hypothetical protein RLP09_36180 [Sandaracinaceae bacterium]|nr:hypothetical protein [Myxococcales bacterium]